MNPEIEQLKADLERCKTENTYLRKLLNQGAFIVIQMEKAGDEMAKDLEKYHFRDDYDDKERWLEGLASTPHEALDNHVTSRFKTVGLHREPNGLDNFTYNLTYPQTWGDFKTPFNLKEALYDLSNFHRDNGKHLSIVPFSNHIKVYQPGMRSIDESRHYIYYPETEQLHKVGE